MSTAFTPGACYARGRCDALLADEQKSSARLVRPGVAERTAFSLQREPTSDLSLSVADLRKGAPFILGARLDDDRHAILLA
jgi:hypothetical protein